MPINFSQLFFGERRPLTLNKGESFILQEDFSALKKYTQTLWDFLPIPICYTNSTFDILDVDKNFEIFSKYQLSEIVGKNFSELLFNKDDFQFVSTELSQAKAVVGEDVVFLDKNHRELLVSLSAVLCKDNAGAVAGYFFAFSDITANKQLEQQLKERLQEAQIYANELEQTRISLLNILEDVGEERKKAEQERDRNVAIIRHLADGILIINQSKIILANPVFEKTFSIKAEEIIGRDIFKPQKQKSLGLLVKLLKEKNFNLRKDELVLPGAVTLEVTVTLLVQVGGEPAKMVVVRDITREKLVETMKTDFVSIAAHQLRTPLSAIKWMVRMILDGDMGKVSPTHKEFLEKTYQSNERMIRLVNDLLNVMRIEEGRFLRDVGKGDIIEIAKQLVDSLQDNAKKKQLYLRFDNLAKDKGELPQLLMDKEKISSALQNLIDNALNYTKKGGVAVLVDYVAERKEYLIKVQDTGIGISLEQQSHVFQKFFRAINAVEAEAEGTGLGLFIAKNVIESHGGRIWFESKENVGATFFVALPVIDKEIVRVS